uniref:Dihydrodipicolinate reductase C-terminal domain-containing protein n=1 Tax=Haptolina brevifila TaxID=156173 RepID=A0A7S2JSF3_9EUKA|mmetsp:Transcript_8763/g.17813  ORF Transcript_8763/g.17813 Transcript_8763/m.17813 type:complete len:142 (+) Transcript_8763:481-906(+)
MRAVNGYRLSVVESHQETKADTSGTAKAISASLAKLTAESDFGPERIERVRDPPAQLAGGGPSHAGVSPVPESALQGHAFHTYSLTSADGDVEFQFRHNVVGRSTYAEGTVDAAIFLARRVAACAQKRVYDMVDVLKAGEM